VRLRSLRLIQAVLAIKEAEFSSKALICNPVLGCPMTQQMAERFVARN
jgi:hypothetical protein